MQMMLKHFSDCLFISAPHVRTALLQHGITATFVASERVFSKTGYIVSDRRALLKPSEVQKLTFLNCNWHL